MNQTSGRNDESVPDSAVRLRAYHLWEQRGRPWGTPDADWFTAERELLTEQEAAHLPPTVLAARAVGSVLGSVAGIVTSLSDSLLSE